MSTSFNLTGQRPMGGTKGWGGRGGGGGEGALDEGNAKKVWFPDVLYAAMLIVMSLVW